MKRLRIGLFPYSANLTHPADRRRIVSWARAKGHTLLVGESKDVDFILISEGVDFIGLSKTSGPPKIFDLIDGYLAKQDFHNDLIRGVTKSLIRQHHTFPRSYTSMIAETCRKVDLVICSSVEQKSTILPHNQNVHTILDNHSEFPLRPYQPNKANSKPLFFWEGTTHTLGGLEQLSEVLQNLTYKFSIVTDTNHPSILGKYFNQDVKNRLKKSLHGHNFQFHPWSIQEVIARSSEAHLALVPVDLDSGIQRLKPENRLLIMFRLGVPCLTSAISSYKRVESILKTKVTCESPQDWNSAINHFLFDQELAAHQVAQGQKYLKEQHNEDLLFDKWDKAISSLI